MSNQYNAVYAYYFGSEYGICNSYNIHDIIDMMETIAHYVTKSNIGWSYLLLEDCSKRIFSQKYPNGAFRGIVIVPEWPDGASVYTAIKMAHVSEKVYIDEELKLPEGFIVEGDGKCPKTKVYTKIRANVKINTLLAHELEVYKQSECYAPLRKITSNESTCSCLDGLWTYGTEQFDADGDNLWSQTTDYAVENNVWSDVVSSKKSNKKQKQHIAPNQEEIDEYAIYRQVPMYVQKQPKEYKENTIGLYRYMQYLNENDLWTRLGEGYMVIGNKDDYQSSLKNLHNSILLYNPNEYPVRMKIMVFS